jgi:His/Glu/Gln/Arg/opine family amino acid ABC transporter permease subunit
VILASNVSFDWGVAWQYHHVLLGALGTAMECAAVALVISVAAGLLVALGRMSRTPVRFLAAAYVNIFRGVPMLVTALWVYFGLSVLFGINFSPFQAGVIALVLLYTAFIAEIYRSALEAINKGQREAGLAIGLHRLQVFLRVVLPQATRIAVPNIGSMFIGMIKDTSVLYAIGVTEVIYETQNAISSTYQPFVLYTVAAGMYVVVAFVLDFVFRLAERVLAKPARGRLAGLLTARQTRRALAVANGSIGPVR